VSDFAPIGEMPYMGTLAGASLDAHLTPDANQLSLTMAGSPVQTTSLPSGVCRSTVLNGVSGAVPQKGHRTRGPDAAHAAASGAAGPVAASGYQDAEGSPEPCYGGESAELTAGQLGRPQPRGGRGGEFGYGGSTCALLLSGRRRREGDRV